MASASGSSVDHGCVESFENTPSSANPVVSKMHYRCCYPRAAGHPEPGDPIRAGDEMYIDEALVPPKNPRERVQAK
ncbi:MAG: hypothetical protein ACREXY_25895 [Gammaproteobacteria bacterium]